MSVTDVLMKSESDICIQDVLKLSRLTTFSRSLDDFLMYYKKCIVKKSCGLRLLHLHVCKCVPLKNSCDRQKNMERETEVKGN